jgi:hypothetical protein
MTEGPALARQKHRGKELWLLLIPEYKAQVERLLEEARDLEARKDTSHFAPEIQPSEFTITRMLLEELYKNGEVNFHEFSLRDELKSALGDGSLSSSYLTAVGQTLRILNISE